MRIRKGLSGSQNSGADTVLVSLSVINGKSVPDWR